MPPAPTRRHVLALLAALPAALALRGARAAAAADDSRARFASPGPHAVEVIDAQWTDAARQRALPLRLRLPNAAGSRPLILFSHGLGGSVDGGRFWGEHWASHGLAVIHLQHPGSDEAVWKDAKRPARELKRAAGLDQFAARVADVKFVLDELQRRRAAGDALALRADLARIGMSGHSFGAVTTQAVAGQRFEVPARLRAEADALADPRPRAFIAFSPSARNDEAVAQFASITRPFLSVTGSADGMVGLGLGVPPYRRRLPFEGMPGPDQYLLDLEGADHMIFNGAPRRKTEGVDAARDERHVALVRAVTLAFWQAHLQDDAAARAWLHGGAAAAVAADGVFMRK